MSAGVSLCFVAQMCHVQSSSVSKQLQPKASTSKAVQKEETDDMWVIRSTFLWSQADLIFSEMRKLDSTLQSMIATLPSSSFTSSTDRLAHAPVQKNTPLPVCLSLFINYHSLLFLHQTASSSTATNPSSSIKSRIRTRSSIRQSDFQKESRRCAHKERYASSKWSRRKEEKRC